MGSQGMNRSFKDLFSMIRNPEEILRNQAPLYSILGYANGGEVQNSKKENMNEGKGLENLFNNFIKDLENDLNKNEKINVAVIHPMQRQGHANGGNVKTHITTTVPPEHGPSPYGIASMFKPRYI